MLRLYNSLTKQKEDFQPIDEKQVGMYTCGMTVYDHAHIGHGRKYVGDDILRRALTYLGYKVKHVQNVTDVGHLVSDADEGEDKLEKGARKAQKTVWEVAEFFTKDFYDSMAQLNVLEPHVISKATEHIQEQINLVQRLVDKEIAYDTPEAVYFDVAKFPKYAELFGQNIDEKQTASREEVQTGSCKKHPADFALWFKRVGRFENHVMHWDSPWGDGFPGWHIECSAMSMKYLGEHFDIHTGGIDHLSIHHPNEIAQSEAATGKPFANIWVHHGFLTVDNQKMSKSLENFYTVQDVIEKGYSPMDLRYLYLTAHYRRPMNFTWEALNNARNARIKLVNQVSDLKNSTTDDTPNDEAFKQFNQAFIDAISDDLNMPQAVAVVWDVLKSKEIEPHHKFELISQFDNVLGLGIFDNLHPIFPLPDSVIKLTQKRATLRKDKKFEEADKIKEKIRKAGFDIKDHKDGSELIPLDK